VRKTKPGIHIMGERPLVDELAALCSTHGLRVSVGLNPGEKAAEKRSSRSTRSTVPADTVIGVELTNLDFDRKRSNLEKLDRALKKTNSVILSSSVTVTASEQASWITRPDRLVGISALPSLLSRQLIEFAATPRTTKAALMRAQEFFIQLGKEVSVVQDRAGMVMPRILCMIINEAYFALQEDIASPKDVDVAMKLGTNYPQGPIEWGEKIGLRYVEATLRALTRDLAEDRYRVAPLLKQITASHV